MKVLLFLLILVVGAGTAPSGVKSKLVWDPNPEPDISGYMVYAFKVATVTNTTGQLVQKTWVDAPETEVLIRKTVPTNELHSLWMFRATAVNLAGLESEFSNPAYWSAVRPSNIVLRTVWEINLNVDEN